MRHHLRKGDREPQRFNYATDIETDLLLQKDGFVVDLLPYDESWDGRNAEWIYDHIPDFMVKFDNIDQHPYPSPGIPGTPPPEDAQPARDEDDASPEDTEGETEKQGKTGEGKGAQAHRLRCELPVRRDDPVFDPDLKLSIEADIGEEWQEITEAEAQAAKGRGTLPGHFGTLVDNIRKKQVDWRRELADSLTLLFKAERQWIPPNRRHVPKKLYLPSRGRRPVLEAAVVIDTSGSTGACLRAFLGEITGIFQSFGDYRITLIQCDAAIQDVKVYTNDDPPDDLEHFQFRGMGGTDLRPPFTYVDKSLEAPPQILIYLTDGMGPAPKRAPDYPVIWCLVEDGVKPAAWGKAIFIECE